MTVRLCGAFIKPVFSTMESSGGKPSSTDLQNEQITFGFSLFQLQVRLVVAGGPVMGYLAVFRAQRPAGLTLQLLLLSALLAAVFSAESSDYYDLLGVSREATTREIRRAFKQLALTMHPDKNPVSQSGKARARNVDRNIWFTLDVHLLLLLQKPGKTDTDPSCFRATRQLTRNS